MSRFPKPIGAIESYEDLRVGDTLFHVYGIWQPFCAGKNVVLRAPYPYREHPDYTSDSTQGDLLVFNVGRDDYSTIEFATDGNMVPGKSHNDNYWFRTEDEAKAAVLYLREQWLADPNSIARELEDRDALFDDEDCYRLDYDYEEEWAA